MVEGLLRSLDRDRDGELAIAGDQFVLRILQHVGQGVHAKVTVADRVVFDKYALQECLGPLRQGQHLHVSLIGLLLRHPQSGVGRSQRQDTYVSHFLSLLLI